MIESTKNQQVKNLTGLVKKSKQRKEEGVYVVEGPRMFEEAPREELVKAYMSESFYNKMLDKDSLKGVDYEILRDDVYEYVSDTKTPQGVMCIMRQKQYSEEDILSGEDAFIMFIENLQDPGNLGTILRAAEGAGVTGIVMSQGTVDIYNPKTIRSTMGSIYRVPFVYTDDIIGSIKKAQAKGVKVYAAHLEGKNSYDSLELKEKSGFIIGNEGAGISSETAEAADLLMIIPMQGQVESLNAAVAATVLMYETARQRR